MRLFLILACLLILPTPVGLRPALGAGEEDARGGLLIVVQEDGVSAAGRLPERFPVRGLKKRIPGIDLSGGVESTGKGDASEWERAIDAVTIVLPRLRQGAARIAAKSVDISGTLQPGFDAEATRGAVRLALGTAWEAEINLAEAPPSAKLELRKDARGLAVRGILPAGIEPAEAQVLLGEPVATGLTGGGDGDAAIWKAALGDIGLLLATYADATGSVSGSRVEIAGTLLPGYVTANLRGWLANSLGERWQVTLEGAEKPAREGDKRLDPATGLTEQLRRGYWLPVLDFDPSPPACARQTAAVLDGRHITFVSGTTRVEPAAEPLLDRLAGVAIRCLNEGGETLVIGGHTDNVGAAEDNLALSRERAMAVMLALMNRGVRIDAMIATGYGETQPIADNGTLEGQALNRRISFDWKE